MRMHAAISGVPAQRSAALSQRVLCRANAMAWHGAPSREEQYSKHVYAHAQMRACTNMCICALGHAGMLAMKDGKPRHRPTHTHTHECMHACVPGGRARCGKERRFQRGPTIARMRITTTPALPADVEGNDEWALEEGRGQEKLRALAQVLVAVAFMDPWILTAY